MMSLNEMIIKNISAGMTRREAESYVCQEIVLSKISKSKYLEKVLIKGGVVMFNYTHNIRRTTNDLDFDFVRYDISNESLYSFIDDLNVFEQTFLISIVSIEELHQDDYHGKRLWVTISDQKTKLKFKMDIGVHTLTMVEQDKLVFVFLHLPSKSREPCIATARKCRFCASSRNCGGPFKWSAAIPRTRFWNCT